MDIENMSRDELIKAIVDWEVNRFFSQQGESDLRNILLYGHGYKTSGLDGRDNWDVNELRIYAKDLGM